MSDQVGQQFGNYRLTRLLGSGGFADVYLGEHIYLKTQAAMKVLQTQMKPNEFQDFLTEAQTIAALKHLRIVRVLDFGVQGTLPFLVMDYAPLGTLRDRHPEGSVLPVATILLYVKQMAEALQYAHDHQLVHRDIKPENMLVESANTLLLSDFGLAIIAHKTQSLSTQEAIGTVSYMAPEQIRGKARPASDQYSLGIVVYEWLCGACPFDGATSIEIAMSHLTDPPPSLRAKVPSISVEIEQVVLKALAKDPQHRFVSVQAFAEALEQASQPALPSTVYVPPPASPIPPTQPVAISYSPLSPPIPAPSITSSGSMFGYDLQHTHFNPHERILSPSNVSRLVLYWTASTEGSIDSSPTVANGVVYVGSNDKKLYAFEATTGKTLWTAATEGSITSSAAVANGVVYVGSEDHKLYALEAETGKTLWSAATGGEIISSPAVTNGVVYVGSYDSKLYAFEAETGKPLWSAATGGFSIITSSLAVANGVAYIGSGNHKLYAFEAETGTSLWTASIGGNLFSSNHSSPAVANGVVYVGSEDHTLYAFEAETGKTLWAASTTKSIYSSPAVANSVVYVGSNDKKLHAFEAETGKTLWTASIGGKLFSFNHSSPAVANGVIYVGSEDKKLYAFEAETGKTLWTGATGDIIRSSPAVANGVVYVGCDDKKLYAFHLR